MINDLLKDLAEDELHSIRYVFSKDDSKEKFVKIITDSIDNHKKFIDDLDSLCVECFAEYLYSVKLDKMLKYFFIKEKNKKEV